MFEQPKQLAIKLAAAGIAVAACFDADTAILPRAAWAPVAALLTLGLASTLRSPLPAPAWFGEYTSYQGFLHGAALAILLAGTTAAARGTGGTRRLLVAIVVGLALVAGYALLQLAGLDPADWSVAGPVLRTFSTEGNPLLLGHTLAAGLPVAVALTAGSGRWTLAVALLSAGLLSAGSRSALGAALVGAMVAWRLAAKPGRRWIPLAAAVLVPAALGAIVLPAEHNPFPALAGRLADAVNGREGRLPVWAMAGRLVARAPLLGHGPDSFATLAPSVQTPALWHFLWHGSPEKAHDEVLQAAATLGLPAVGILLWLSAMLWRLAGRARGDPMRAAAAGSLAANGVCALFGFSTCGPEAMAVAAAAVLLADLPAVRLPRSAAPLFAALLCGSLVLHGGLAGSEVALKASLAREGVGLAAAAGWPTPWAQSLLRAGDTVERGVFGGTLGGGRAGVTAPRLVADLQLLYGRATRVNPLHPFGHSDLGRLAARAGRWDEADAAYRRARALAPLDAYLVLEHAQALMAAARFDAAETALGEAAVPYPEFAEPVGLQGYLALMRRNTAAAEALLSRSLDLDWHGNTAAASAAANNLAALLHRQGRETEARQALFRAQQFSIIR